MTGGPFPGPAELGRGAVILPGQQVPAALDGALVVRIDDADLAHPAPVAHRLHRRWMARQPTVIELGCDADALRAPERTDAEPWSLDGRFEFARERLQFLVWANTYDLRDGRPRWWHAVKAERACPGVRADGPADVVLPDGTPAWVDAGPRQPLRLPAGLPQAVVHRDSAETGRLTPAPGAHGDTDPADRDAAVGGAPGPDVQTGPGASAGPAGPDVARPRGLAADQRAAVRLRGLAADQRAAVLAATSTVRVVAPAGSGKTRVLTARLRHLLVDRGYEPDLLLALAYNTAAARQIAARVTAATGARASNLRPHVATLHAHAYALLRRHRGDLVVWEEARVRDALQRLVHVERQVNTDPYAPYLEALEEVRTRLVDPRHVEASRDDVPGLAEAFPRYRAMLADQRALDFAEMVYAAVELLLRDPAARRAEQARARHVLVDEFQDLSPAYLLLLRLLAAPALQVFGVGDDDQVIYGHAGATPDFLLDFADLFPGAVDHPLQVNYRCPPAIVSAATTLLGHNRRRVGKRIRPAAGRTDPPDALRVLQVDPADQARAGGEVVAAWLDGGAAPAEIAVLARVNAALLAVQVELATRRIMCASPLGPSLLRRTGVRAALAYLRLAVAAERLSGDDLAEVLYRPFRRLPGWLRDRLRGRTWSVPALRRLGDDADLSRGATRAWETFVGDLELLARTAAGQRTADVLRAVRDAVGLGEAAESLDDSAGEQVGASHADDLDALLQVAHHCPEPDRFAEFLAEILAWANPPDGDGVLLSSVHRIKGREWPHVLLVAAAEGIVPHRLVGTAAGMEEERRVFHVALTRASHDAVVIAPKVGRSRFLAEMAGEPSGHGSGDGPAPRPPTARPARQQDRAPRVAARVGLALEAPGGIRGEIERLVDTAALVRTSSGALLRVRYGTQVITGERRGRLTAGR